MQKIMLLLAAASVLPAAGPAVIESHKAPRDFALSADPSDSNWKVNHNDFGVVRNRYKNAEVLIVIKGTKTCVAVPANAAQKSMGGGKFANDYDFDQFLEGSAVPCP